jgi:lactose/cellobiose-specific phosphotransferase system IIC component
VAVHLMRAIQKHDSDLIPDTLVGVSAFANFMVVVLSGPFSPESLSYQSIFLGVVIGISTAELLRKLAYLRFFSFLRMPYESNSEFYYVMWLSPAIILLGLITLLVSTYLTTTHLLPVWNIAPLTFWMEQQPGAIWLFHTLSIIINQVFWSIGFHGWLVVSGYFKDFILPTGIPYDGVHVYKPLLTSFLLIGGSGATLGLLIAIFMKVKRGYQRKIGLISIVPAFFNINDTLLYGLPIILNPHYLIPFICVPLLINFMLLIALETGFIVPLHVDLSFTTPPLISGWLLTGSWHGVAFQVVSIIVSTIIYIPFVKKVEALRQSEELTCYNNATQAILTNRIKPLPSTERDDGVGMVARGLLNSLLEDLEHQRIYMVYQPMHSSDGELVGMEALLRWPHESYGLIRPEVAVTLAEESHHIQALGSYVIEHAFAFKQKLNSLGYQTLNIAINIAPAQLMHLDMVETIERLLIKYQLTPDQVELEITESSILPDHPAISETLSRLSALGVGLALDDFGMGYASLHYLNRFKVDTIKIDGSLTIDVINNEVKADIIRTIVALGVSQKINVVAEYVETEAQNTKLIEMGCTILQGYLYSKPLDEENFVTYLMQQCHRKA